MDEEEYNWSSRYVPYVLSSEQNGEEPNFQQSLATTEGRTVTNQSEQDYIQLEEIKIEGQVHVPHRMAGSGVPYAVPHRTVYNESNVNKDQSNVQTSDSYQSGKRERLSGSRRSKWMIVTIFVLVVTVISLAVTVALLRNQHHQAAGTDKTPKLTTSKPSDQTEDITWSQQSNSDLPVRFPFNRGPMRKIIV